jgi:hypothetical protein
MRDMYTEFINPIYGTHRGLPVIMVGAIVLDAQYRFVVVGSDGEIGTAEFKDLQVDVRFDGTEWKDVSPGPEDAPQE